MRGRFIVIDGPDGCGKTTQARLLSQHLRGLGYSVLGLREPGGTALGEKIRRLLLAPTPQRMTATTELFLYLASRAQLVEAVIKPALKKGKIIICDRFLSSTIAYQGRAGGLGARTVENIGQVATRQVSPDLTIILDINPRAGLRRKASQKHNQPDRMEQKQLIFHRRVRQGFLQLARQKPARYQVIKARQPIRLIQQQIRALVAPLLPAPPAG